MNHDAERKFGCVGPKKPALLADFLGIILYESE
jgi:hypothetical protein